MAPVSLPPFPSSAMDGYACRSEDLRNGAELSLIGESLAGHPFDQIVAVGECIRITTGAAVPATTDTVVIQENTSRTGTKVTLIEAPAAGANIRITGHDVEEGQKIAGEGQRLNPMDLGWIAACGVAAVTVRRKVRVAVFSTGDELVEPGKTLQSGQIYDSNRFAVSALLSHLPVEVTDLGVLPDQPEAIKVALADAAASQDLLLTSGGVSVGDADFVKEVVEALGVLTLWKMNLKPGKPLAYGQVRDSHFLGLPGNPVSTIVTFLLVARPLILKLAGTDPGPAATQPARLSTPVRHNPGREEYQRGILSDRDEERWVTVAGDQSSNRLATFSGADCLIRIPKDVADLEMGERVEVLPFYGLLS